MSNPVTMELVRMEGAVPPPDMLLVGPKGAVHIDLVTVLTPTGATLPLTLKRGTLLMFGTVGSGADAATGYVPCTEAGLSAAGGFAILTDDTTIDDSTQSGTSEHAETTAYFEGDFNEDAVILPWVDPEDENERAAALEAAREPLRRAKIFLRHVHN